MRDYPRQLKYLSAFALVPHPRPFSLRATRAVGVNLKGNTAILQGIIANFETITGDERPSGFRQAQPARRAQVEQAGALPAVPRPGSGFRYAALLKPQGERRLLCCARIFQHHLPGITWAKAQQTGGLAAIQRRHPPTECCADRLHPWIVTLHQL